MMRILLVLSHSSSASTTTTCEDWQPFSPSFDSGRRTSCYHWSRRDWLAMSRRFTRALHICGLREGMLLASCTAMLITNLAAWPTSPPPREKKKLAPRRFWSKYLRATVRATVDFPVPAKPFSQKMQRSSWLSAQLHISWRRSTRVSGRQVGSCCRCYALNGASAAIGRELSTSFTSGLPVSLTPSWKVWK
jgi:hypothetical protein